MRELITEEEYQIMDSYREDFGVDEDKSYESEYEDENFSVEKIWSNKADIKSILLPWEENKAFLFKLFGNQLIVSKKISDILVQPDGIKMAENYQKLIFLPFWVELKNYIDDKKYRDLQYYLYNYTHDQGDTIRKDITFENSEQEKPLILREGVKFTRAIGKIAKYYDIPDYEEFRIALSMAHQEILKKKDEILYLSIHPLDFITMSDNTNNWESCMSWQQSGCYRAGTVAMMNSPCVLVAYLTSSNPMRYIDYELNNKKYRQLIIVDEKFLATVRPYPYKSDILDHEILSFIKELYQKNIDAQATFSEDYSYVPKLNYCPDDAECRKICFDCGDVMYNDFCHSNHKISFREDIPFYEGIKYYEYNGPSECMWCGQTEPCLNTQEFLICEDCLQITPNKVCDQCGDSSGELTEVDGTQYCSYCYEHYIREDAFTGDLHSIEDMQVILLWNPTTQDFYKNTHGEIGVYAYYYKRDIPETITYNWISVNPRKYSTVDILPVEEEDLNENYTISYIDYWEDLTKIKELI